MATQQIKITKKIAQRVIEVVDQGLSQGIGDSTYNRETEQHEGVPGQMCIEAAVCYAFGWEHDDHPKCVSSSVRDLKVTVNDYDGIWNTNAERAASLRRLAVAQLGSKGVVSNAAFDKAITALFYDNFSKVLPERPLLTLPKLPVNPSAEALRKQQEAASNLLTELEGYASSCGELADNTGCPKDAEAYLDFLREQVNYSSAALRVKVDEFCEDVVGILRKLKSPGVKYLYLTETKAKKKASAKKR